MIFLNPAILIGLLAAGFPVIIHLFNIRKVKNVEFSTLMFLKEIQKNKIRKVKLKQWLLLFLRTLLIIFLVLAFARPTLESVSLGNSSVSKSSVCFLIDNSFSLQLKNENGSGFNQVKSSVKKIISTFQDSDEISLIAFSGEKTENPVNKNKANLFLDKLKIEKNKPYITEQLNSAFQTLENSNNLYKEIYVVSDFQNNLKSDLENYIKSDKTISLFFINAKFENLDNLSVTKFNLEDKIITKGKTINFSAEVFNSTNNKHTGKVASLVINGEKKAQKSFDIDPERRIVLNFETVLEFDGLVEAFIEIEDDTILEDNKRYLSFYVPEKINTLILADNINDAKFLDIVLSGNVSSLIIEKVVKSTSQFNSEKLENYDVVFLIGSRLINESKEIKNYLTNGGSLVYFVSSDPNLININSFLNSISSINQISIAENKESINNYFENIDFNHVLFKDLFIANKQKFSSPEIHKYLKIKNSYNAKKIISLLDGSPILLEEKIGNGNLLFFTISPELSFSNFPVKGVFAPLISKMVLYGSQKNHKNNNIVVGEKVLISKNDIISSRYKVIHPDLSEEFIIINQDYNRLNSEFRSTKKTGVYKFYSNDKLIEYFSVNFDPSESDLFFIDKDELEKIGKKINPDGYFQNVSINDNLKEIIEKTRFGTELWQYFLISALIIALFEMFIARGVKKEIAEMV